MFPNHPWTRLPGDNDGPLGSRSSHPVALILADQSDTSPELRQVLQQSGYRVIDTDNGLEATRHARQTQPHILVVDMDVPLLYELVAARQIIKHAQAAPFPVVIVTHEEIVDRAPMMEVGARRDEYVTRLSDYQELKPLLDYLLPVLSLRKSANM